jgi:hypothetical protein
VVAEAASRQQQNRSAYNMSFRTFKKTVKEFKVRVRSEARIVDT